jgi:hypothetical protein
MLALANLTALADCVTRLAMERERTRKKICQEPGISGIMQASYATPANHR